MSLAVTSDGFSSSSVSRSEFYSTLGPEEIFWRDRQPFLERRGYVLRPRYHPNWIPSWSGTTPNRWFNIEDAHILPFRHGNFIDATRISDGKLVYLKQVPTESVEVQLMRYLSSEPLCNDPRNHCIPLLDVLVDDEDESSSFIVMPLLHAIDDPPFETVWEFMVCAEQLFQGLVFMHEHGVAHRDCSFANVRMDASLMYPHGFHPVISGFLPDLSGPAWPLPRSITNVKYYFLDFDISLYYPPDYHPKIAHGADGLDREPPELDSDAPYDPFKLDVFILGNLFRRRFLDVFSNLDFLHPLIEKMTRHNPADRPDAIEVLDEWHVVKNGVSVISRNWRLKGKNEDWQVGMDIYGLIKVGLSRTSLRRFL